MNFVFTTYPLSTQSEEIIAQAGELAVKDNVSEWSDMSTAVQLFL